MDERSFYNEFYRARTRGWRTLRDLIRVSEHLIAHHVLAAAQRFGTSQARVLDLGCGRGQLSRKLQRFGRVLGVDYSSTAVAFCRKAYPDLAFEVGDVFEDDWLAGHGAHYDLLVSTEVIEHIARDRQADFVARCCSLCEPGGLLILTTPCRETVDLMKTDPNLSEEAYYQQHERQPIANLLFTHQLAGLIPKGYEVLAHETFAPFIRPRLLDLFWKCLTMPSDYRWMDWVQRRFGYPGRVQIICVRVPKR